MQDYSGPGPRASRFHDHGRAQEHFSYIGNMTIFQKNSKVALAGDCLEKFKVETSAKVSIAILPYQNVA